MKMNVCDVEIENIASLNEREEALADNHSVLNVLNIVHAELALLGVALDNNLDLAAESQELCRKMISSLTDSSMSLIYAANSELHSERILAEIARLRLRHPIRAHEGEVEQSVANIEELLKIWNVRAQELLARAQHPVRWETFSTRELTRNFERVFAAMAKQSRGRIRFINDPAQLDPASYFIDLKFGSRVDGLISMPAVVVDVMRDLIANARKYTAPGGSILANLEEGDWALEFSVQDNGRGIAEHEIRSVVEYGYRGSNVADVRTRGGGFGLTKAFLVTKRFGGRFWIGSRLGEGTRVRFALPHP